MGLETESVHPMNPLMVSDVVKKLLTTFFSANIPYSRGLDIYGSIHVRSDDCDVVCCVLNEHCLKPDKAVNSNDRSTMPLLSGAAGTRPGSCLSNATSNNEYLADCQAVGSKKSRGKKPGSRLEENEEHAGSSTKNSETQPKRKKLPGLSRKLSKLNRASTVSMNFLAQSVFPEPLAFGSSGDRNTEDEKSEVKRNWAMTEEDALGNDSANRSACKSEDQVNSDDPSIDLAMAATSEIDAPQKSGARFDNDGEVADIDSSDDSRDFGPVERVGSYSFGSPQSFNHHSTPFFGSNMPQVSFNETEMLSQSSWFPPSDASARGGNQAGSSSSFDGSTKPPGPLTSEKICMYCLKIFHTNLEMSQHIQQQHNSGFPLLDNNDDRPYRPRYQNAYAYGGSELDADRQLACSVCSLSFRSLDGLRCHENSKHSRNKLYKCQFCTQSFLTRQAAYTHRMKFHRLIPRNPQLLAGAMAHI